MASMATTVTIDKVYFETLLRRAEFHTSGRDLTTPVHLPTVTIPKVDHDNLLRMVREYNNLKNALHRGGIAAETLEVLIFDDGTSHALGDGLKDDGTFGAGENDFVRQKKRPVTLSAPPTDPDSNFTPSLHPRNQNGYGHSKDRSPYSQGYGYGHDDTSFQSDLDKDEQLAAPPKVERQPYARSQQRTVLVKNLSDRTTHKDIVDVVRGGALLDIYMRTNDRHASVSFVEGTAAQDFMTYVKRNDIYIHGKRAEFAWNDRQFVLPGHVANKISIGATRNLVIRGVHPNITADRIREDLDHIHNLVIIDIKFQNGDAFIHLNSVHNSLFARTCMMSRACYKGMRIEWYPDECARSIPKAQHVPKKENANTPAKKSTTTINRFQMLNMDGAENGSEEEDQEDFTAFAPVNNTNGWSTPTLAA